MTHNNFLETAAGKWKQRCLIVQAQLDAREKDLSLTSEAVSQAHHRAASAESEIVRLKEQLYSSEKRSDSAKLLRNQLNDFITAHQHLSQQHESIQCDLQATMEERDKYRFRIQEEVKLSSSLRSQLDTAAQQNSKTISEITVSISVAERSRDEAQKEATLLRTHLAALEKELRVANSALQQMDSETRRGSTAYGHARTALSRADERLRTISPHHPDNPYDTSDDGEKALQRLEKLLNEGLA